MRETDPYDSAEVKTLVALSVATSTNAWVIGEAFACLSIGSAAVRGRVGSIGFVAFLLSLTGLSVGILFGRRYNFRAGLLGGLLLIGIGSKILVEHLFC